MTARTDLTPEALDQLEALAKAVMASRTLPTLNALAAYQLAANPATTLALIAEVRRLRESQRSFSTALGFGNGVTEPAASLADMIHPIEDAMSAALDHDECPVTCELCGDVLAATQCPTCHGSGCLPNAALAYLECDLCAGVGKIHEGCAEKPYADLVVEVRQLREERGHLDHQLDVDRKHAALAEGESCDVCSHLEIEQMAQHGADLMAENDALLAKIERVRALADHNEGYEHNGHPTNLGEPECPGCWRQDILNALDCGAS